MISRSSPAPPFTLSRPPPTLNTSSPAPPVKASFSPAPARPSGGTGPRMVIDLGLPRNICPDVAELGDVDLLDLETISVHAPLPDFQAGEDARALIGRAVDEYRAAQDATAVTPGIVAYRGHVSDLADAEIERLRRRGESSPAAERALKHLASVLVHTPSVRGREFAASGQAERFTAALETVFGLELEPAAPAEPSGLSALDGPAEDAAAS